MMKSVCEEVRRCQCLRGVVDDELT
jgi:hypothetical protein